MRGHELPQKFATGAEGFGFPTPQNVTGDTTKGLLHPVERVVPESRAADVRQVAREL